MSQYLDNITSILGIIDKTVNTYEANKKRVTELEGMSNDLIHEVSIGKKRGVVEGYKLYEQLRDVLVERYEKRDGCDELEPLYNFFTSNKNIRNDLNRVLTETQKVNKRLENRTYVPRVLDEEELTMKISPSVEQKNKPFKQILNEFKADDKDRKKHKFL
jgi:hypothetical protein